MAVDYAKKFHHRQVKQQSKIAKRKILILATSSMVIVCAAVWTVVHQAKKSYDKNIPAEVKTNSATKTSPKFEFYTMLPNATVDLDNSAAEQTTGQVTPKDK